MSSDTMAAFDLTGRVAVVTGASRGIGNSIASGLLDRGASVVITSRKDDEVTAAAAELAVAHDAPDRVLGVAAHMGRLDDLDRLVASTVARFEGIDLLVNNAANALALPVPEITEEAWAKSFDVNLRGPVFLFQRCLPHLTASEHAAVLNVISAGAYMITPGQLMYGAAKNALLHVTRSLAAEYASAGIRVNALAPGTTDTKMVRNLGEGAIEHMARVSHLGRVAHPDEMIGAALLLLSDAGSYITGQCIIVDGGWVPAR